MCNWGERSIGLIPVERCESLDLEVVIDGQGDGNVEHHGLLREDHVGTKHLRIVSPACRSSIPSNHFSWT